MVDKNFKVIIISVLVLASLTALYLLYKLKNGTPVSSVTKPLLVTLPSTRETIVLGATNDTATGIPSVVQEHPLSRYPVKKGWL